METMASSGRDKTKKSAVRFITNKRQSTDDQKRPAKQRWADDNSVGLGSYQILKSLVSMKISRNLNRGEAFDTLGKLSYETLLNLHRLECRETIQELCPTLKIKMLEEREIGNFLHDTAAKFEFKVETRDAAKYAVGILFSAGDISIAEIQLKSLVILYIFAKQLESEQTLPCVSVWVECLCDEVSINQFISMELEIWSSSRLQCSKFCTPAHFIYEYAKWLPAMDMPVQTWKRLNTEVLAVRNTAGSSSARDEDDSVFASKEIKQWLKSSSASKEVRSISRDIIEKAIDILSNPTLSVLEHPPSRVAAAALFLSRQALGMQRLWPDCLVYLTGFRLSEMLITIDILARDRSKNCSWEIPSLEDVDVSCEGPASEAPDNADAAHTSHPENSMLSNNESSEGEAAITTRIKASKKVPYSLVEVHAPSKIHAKNVSRKEAIRYKLCGSLPPILPLKHVTSFNAESFHRNFVTSGAMLNMPSTGVTGQLQQRVHERFTCSETDGVRNTGDNSVLPVTSTNSSEGFITKNPLRGAYPLANDEAPQINNKPSHFIKSIFGLHDEDEARQRVIHDQSLEPNMEMVEDTEGEPALLVPSSRQSPINPITLPQPSNFLIDSEFSLRSTHLSATEALTTAFWNPHRLFSAV
ncbi:Cyclin C-terminal domain [Trinorchestia longiramus]|nr:Cyclin C-terminal domain [Trinorchestia longiramus]